MYLKYLPKDVDFGVLVQISIVTLQSTLMRAQEIHDFEKRRLNDAEIIALRSLLDTLDIVAQDAKKFFYKAKS